MASHPFHMDRGLSLNWSEPYTWLVSGLWAALLIAVPVTSFPVIAERLGAITVAPLSLIPMAVLIIVWLAPDLVNGGRLPFIVWPLIGFSLMGVLSAGAALFLPLEPFKGQMVLQREVRALITLAIGVAFYLCAARFPTTSRRRRWTLAALYAGGALVLVWSTVQSSYILEGLNNVPQDLNEFHRFFSIRDLDRNRVTGFAFEPSWLGDQLVVLYLPLWLGAVLTGRSLLNRPRASLVLELPLLIWGTWILLMTRSRVSVAAMLAVVGLLVLVGLWRLAGWFGRRVMETGWGPVRAGTVWIFRGALMLIGIGMMVAAAYGLFVRFAELDSRMSRALATPSQLPTLRDQHPYTYPYEIASRFAFAERVVYWEASLHPFKGHPLLGVGPGNAGFLFEAGVPAYGYGVGETRAYLEASVPAFPNPKNLWIRLLSETGIAGFGFYVSWLALMGVLAWRALSAGAGEFRWLGAALMLSLAAQVVEGFSLDSFALPQVWLINGLFTASLVGYSSSEPKSGMKSK